MTTEEKIPVLFVDDEENILLLAQYYLSSMGYEVETAKNVAEAKEKLAQTPFKYIISDVRMPGGSGLELLEHIPKLSFDPKIVFVSGYTDVSDAEIRKRGGLGLFEKPANYEDIVDFLVQSEPIV